MQQYDRVLPVVEELHAAKSVAEILSRRGCGRWDAIPSEPMSEAMVLN
jgi:hypothetical protein